MEEKIALAGPSSREHDGAGSIPGRNVCIEHGCTRCCHGTTMALSEEDISRIESLGRSRDSFATESNGLIVLRNAHHRCVFHDGVRCTIYQARPAGCRFYPVVFAEYSGRSTLDSLCPFWIEFSCTPELSRESRDLHHLLIMEARRRKLMRLSEP
ncbi:MAG TPA: YkgJ family cysteine cluster protein [Conexivisphaerales archaeon]|nr:YkgJ family cysteine cluster protein [Conexivisphaerales archaeon]